MKHDLARELYKTWRNNAKRSKHNPTEEVRERVEDPQPLSKVLGDLVSSRDWKQGIAEGTLFTQWASIVGDDIAQHASPVSINENVLTIQTTSTAWATQLTLVSNEVLKTIQNNPFGATIESISIIGPNTPSWKRGIRSTRDARGPRDTYN